MAEGGTTANYCSHCGASLDPDANYCQQCGTQHRETTPTRESIRSDSPDETADTTEAGPDTTDDSSDTTDSDEELLVFRRRVQDHIAEGWDLEHDHGDSVVLADRGLGEAWVHAVLLLFSAGIGNIAYGWYSHSYDADRMLLRADGNTTNRADYETDADASEVSSNSLGSYVLGALLLLIGIAVIAGSPFEVTSLVIGLLFLAGAAWSFPPTKRRLADRHPVTTFGSTHSTETATVSDPSTPCVMCASPVTQGVERRYREEYVVAGVPLFTTESGENHYCRDCAVGDIEDVGITPVTLDADREADDEPAPELER